jgi:hypothetical protein
VTEKTPPRPPIVRPGAEPTHNDEQGGKRWHYLNLDGSKMDPPTFIYEHVSGGFGGECANQCYPDRLFTPPPVPKNGIGNRIECELSDRGFEVIDPPEWWDEAQTIRSALPGGFLLTGPNVIGQWYVSKNMKADPRCYATPTAALRHAIREWTAPPTAAKPSDPGDIRAMTILDPAPMSFTVTLPDGTRIDIGHKPAR